MCSRDRIREQYKDFTEAFRKYDKKSKGYLSVADLQRVLVDFNYFLDDDQFFDLLDRCGLFTCVEEYGRISVSVVRAKALHGLTLAGGFPPSNPPAMNCGSQLSEMQLFRLFRRLCLNKIQYKNVSIVLSLAYVW